MAAAPPTMAVQALGNLGPLPSYIEVRRWHRSGGRNGPDSLRGGTAVSLSAVFSRHWPELCRLRALPSSWICRRA